MEDGLILATEGSSTKGEVGLPLPAGWILNSTTHPVEGELLVVSDYAVLQHRWGGIGNRHRRRADLLSGGRMDKAAHLPGLVRKTGEAAAGADTRSRGRRARRTLDDILQSRDRISG
jgi:hypothetical protein